MKGSQLIVAGSLLWAVSAIEMRKSKIRIFQKHLNCRLLRVVQMALQTEKNIYKLIMHFIADTDTDEDYFELLFFVADTDTAVLCSFEEAT